MEDDISRYFNAHHLQAAWEFGPQIRAGFDAHSDRPIHYEAHGPDAQALLNARGVSDEDKAVTAMQLCSLRRMMDQGPVIVRPSDELCEMMLATEVRINAMDYRQPYEVIGVDLPASLIGPHHPCLTVVWNPTPGVILCWAFSRHSGMTFHNRIGIDLPTIEERLAQGESVCDDQDEFNLMVRGQRIALNLGLLMAHRPTELTPLPPRVVKNRRGRDDRLRQLAARQARRVIFRDLVIKPRPAYAEGGHDGARMAPQLRKGHWKMAAHGPKHSLRRPAWVEPYWTGQGGDEAPPTIIYE